LTIYLRKLDGDARHIPGRQR